MQCDRSMPFKSLVLSVALVLFARQNACSAHPGFAELIPNGLAVPNPGPQGGVWAGVGHVNAAGGGPRNPFGLDFVRQGLEWTVDLCVMDSDGDGRSNGEELGDPDCVWEPGMDPPFPSLSHPGIPDEPVENIVRDPCLDYQDPIDVVRVNISFTSSNEMDETRTHYRCEQFVVNAPDPNLEWHQVKTQVLLDNPNVLHHMWIYHCVGASSSDGNLVGRGPYSCNGVEANCQIVAGWAVGPKEYCEPPNVAAYIDFFSSNVFKIEAHYDNSAGVAQADQSGMQLSLTPTPRALSAGVVVLGMDYWDRQFLVPGGEEEVSLVNICPSSATSMLSHPVWIYSWNPHMHLYGKKLVTEHYRCGEKIGEIGRIHDFDFNNQQSYFFDPPIQILPGDALVTTCTYNTSSIDFDVKGGEETTEEMCDNYLTYYPYAGTNSNPNLFTACYSYEQGLNPEFVDFDDETPFAILDLGGDILLYDWEPDPESNVAECCETNSCDLLFQERAIPVELMRTVNRPDLFVLEVFALLVPEQRQSLHPLSLNRSGHPLRLLFWPLNSQSRPLLPGVCCPSQEQPI